MTSSTAAKLPVEYPFSAVAGQENLKLALTLAAINPRLGGVLISGPRGSAKSTLARGLASILPDNTSAFVTLPLGASEEALLGSIDLDKALNDKAIRFHPGLLSKAHGGILYVDEVNLLADNLVDQLLDVAASGMNRVERDGISHEHEAKFILVGTMNPEEGELRSQLQDRFGLMVTLANDYSLAERVEIVKRRELFDIDPEAFCQQYQSQQEELKQQILQAQVQLPKVRCDDEMRVLIARRCQDAQVDGMRADIVWLGAALAAAAWRGSDMVELDDVNRVEDLVLAHRRQASQTPSNSATPPNTGSSDEGNSYSNKTTDDNLSHSEPKRRPAASYKTPVPSTSKSEPDVNSPTNSSTQNSQPRDADVDWGGMPAQQQSIQFLTGAPFFEPQQKARLQKATPFLNVGKRKGKQVHGYHRQVRQKSRQTDWYATFVEAGLKQQWPPQKRHYKGAKTGQSMLHLIVLDSSASTLGNAVFAKAKGLIVDIARQAYLKREQIAVFTFGNGKIAQAVSTMRSPKDIAYLLSTITAGGGTPMREALLHIQSWLQQLQKKAPALLHHTYIVTDGRTRANVDDINLSGTVSLIDTESQRIKRGKGPALARALGADYISLPI
ncbi:VWA domain-containing protein [Marinomonas agarivorans]|nr:VWA domain-containing protein [Marinomonas agarivorans]